MQINKPVFKFQELETPRLLLRKYKIEDASDIFEMYSNREVMKFAGPDCHFTIEDSKIFIESALSGMAQKKDIFWTISLKSQNKVIGDISLCGIDYKHSITYFGLFLAKEYWNKGIMLEAGKPVIKFAFEDVNINRIEGQMFINHISSICGMEKLKFIKEAELRENFSIEDKFQNSFVYSMLKSDYEKNKEFFNT